MEDWILKEGKLKKTQKKLILINNLHLIFTSESSIQNQNTELDQQEQELQSKTAADSAFSLIKDKHKQEKEKKKNLSTAR